MKRTHRIVASRGAAVLLLPLLFVSIPISSSFAQEGPGSTAGAYLTLPASARSIAMGEVSAALVTDPFNWLSNPGSAHGSSASGIGLFHSQWLLDTYYDNAFYRQRVGRMIALCAGLTYLSAPEIPGYDGMGEKTADLENSSFVGAVGLTLAPLDWIGAGVNVKYFQERIADWTARGYGFDLGATVAPPLAGLSLGAAVQNLGPDVEYDSSGEELPLTYRAGACMRFPLVVGAVGLTLAADMVKPKHEDAYAAFGAEAVVMNVLALRAGYSADETRADDGLTAGGGLRILDRIMIDYAWTPYGDLGTFHRVSVFLSFSE